MAVTSLNGTEQTITAFVQDIIRYARQKVEDGEGDVNNMEEGSDESRNLTTSGHLCNGDATEEEIRDKTEQKHLPSDPSDAVVDKSHEKVSEIGLNIKTDYLDCLSPEQLIAPRAEAEQFIAPQVEVDVTDLDDPEIIESQDEKEAAGSELNPVTINDNENNGVILVVHPNGSTQTVVDYINDIIESARKRANEEAIESLNDSSKKGKKKKRSADSGKQGSRRGSSRTSAVRELISRIFRREDVSDTLEGDNGVGNSQFDNSVTEKSTTDKSASKKNKSNKRHHFKTLLFQKKQKYQVSTEALATDENSREKIRKRQKVGRANSFGKSLRNMLSCSSSVTTV
ncbi:uncharacterized protein LOC132562601 [Ylistrum balloti]|uniref:uncharacterized protein LOC132562601 n=1 Tax=Ylistrum balloti TaxID=509963 RepID=UPI002905AE42|nr:uncharacterized protein LOC132562601 [Ylistrum balloti]